MDGEVAAGEIVVVGGGARSGKSAFAIELADAMPTPRIFMATAEASDAEMHQRIERHKRERDERYVTIEEPIEIVGALQRAEDSSVIVMDCVTLWVSNLLLAGRTDEEIFHEVDRLLTYARSRRCTFIVVTNEVGMGVVPESALGRRFRDCAGRVNQQLAAGADKTFFAAMGCILQFKPELRLAHRVAPAGIAAAGNIAPEFAEEGESP